MKSLLRFRRPFLPLFAASVLLSPAVPAAVVMDQIGTTAADHLNLASMSLFGANQDFEAGFDSFDVALIDDFTVAGAVNVSLVEVVLEAGGGMAAFGAATGWRVELYSSVAAAASSLVGDVASVLLNPGDVTISSIATSASSTSALIAAPVNLNLPGAGTYYVGMIPVLDLNPNGQTFMVASGAFVGSPGGNNAVGVNPGGGFGLGTSAQAEDDAAFRVTTSEVPEASTFGAIGAVLGGIAWSLRRTRRVAG